MSSQQKPSEVHALRYHALYNNQYLRYFQGHTQQARADAEGQAQGGRRPHSTEGGGGVTPRRQLGSSALQLEELQSVARRTPMPRADIGCSGVPCAVALSSSSSSTSLVWDGCAVWLAGLA